ncbi:MAG TPA: S8 family serine peptidase [Frankiaceae bacterium]
MDVQNSSPATDQAATNRAALRSRGRTLLALATTTTLAGGGLLAAAPVAGATTPTQAVIVTAPGGSAQAAASVAAAGGRVSATLSLIGGVAAVVPVGASLPGVSVTPDHALVAQSLPTATGTTGGDPTGYAVRGSVGLGAAAGEGAGVTVAVIDTGVADSPDLAGRVTHVNLSGQRGDGFGHGTFEAGLIAGSGASSGGLYAGTAPGSRLLDLKVAKSDGSTDLVTVLRALQEVVVRSQTDHVRVVNLAFGYPATQPLADDPLAFALEALWRLGVTVVVPSGNDGPGTVSAPGNDSVLLTAGATDTAGTATRTDDTIAGFTGTGTVDGVTKPDVLAPGAHVVSIGAPGSMAVTQNPGSAVAGGYLRGSGTSMSTAVVAGAAADLLAAHPGLTPDQVKQALSGSGSAVPGSTARALDVPAALAAAAALPGADDAGLDTASAIGAFDSLPQSLLADVSEADSAALDALSKAWDAGDPAAALAAWNSVSPALQGRLTATWATLGPVGQRLASQAWAGRGAAFAKATGIPAATWLGRAWSGRAWSGRAWSGRAWSGRAWSGRAWSGRAWSGRAWSGRAWSEEAWNGRAWSGRAWSGRAWSGAFGNTPTDG